ncbi:MAG TPA: hypothetical protein PKJ41_15730 [Bryobacteraceae bacterium]|nr:hypothetical protein [Bryobacteraceae bacterium]
MICDPRRGKRCLANSQGIAAPLHGKHLAAGRWAQKVTVGYEQAHGMRQVNGRSGSITANSIRPLLYPAAAVFDAFTSIRRR